MIRLLKQKPQQRIIEAIEADIHASLYCLESLTRDQAYDLNLLANLASEMEQAHKGEVITRHYGGFTIEIKDGKYSITDVKPIYLN